MIDPKILNFMYAGIVVLSCAIMYVGVYGF